MKRCLISFWSTIWMKYNNNLCNNIIFKDCEIEWTQKVLLSVFSWIRRYIVILDVKQFGATQHKTDIILQPRIVTVSSNHSSRKCATACIRYPLLWIFNGITRCQQKSFGIGARYSSTFLPNGAFNGQWSHLPVFRKHSILAKGWSD